MTDSENWKTDSVGLQKKSNSTRIQGVQTKIGVKCEAWTIVNHGMWKEEYFEMCDSWFQVHQSRKLRLQLDCYGLWNVDYCQVWIGHQQYTVV